MAEAPSEDYTDSSSLLRRTVKLKIDPGKAISPYQYQPPIYGNQVKEVIRTKDKNDQVEAVLEMIDRAKRENTPRGLVLNPSVVTPDKPKKVEEMFHVKKVLGAGNSAGEVYMVEDAGTGKDYALKPILLSQFDKDEIRAWIHLADKGKAPELYSFKLVDGQVFMGMEILEGKTLKDVFETQGFGELVYNPEKSEEKRCLSLILLHGLLENFELLQQGKFTHGDGHGGNVWVSPSLEISLIDFGSAKSFERPNMDHSHRLKADIVNLLRQFCRAFTDVDFARYDQAQKALEKNDFREITELMPHIPEQDRMWLFKVMNLVFDTVRYKNQEGFADTRAVAQEVEAMLPRKEELEKISLKLAYLLFPDWYPNPHHGPECETEADFGDQEGDPIFDDPRLSDLATLVDLKRFGDLSLF